METYIMLTRLSPEAVSEPKFIEKVEKRTAVVGVIGQGYVGLPLGLVFCEAGFRVLGFDVDPANGRTSVLVRFGRASIYTPSESFELASGEFFRWTPSDDLVSLPAVRPQIEDSHCRLGRLLVGRRLFGCVSFCLVFLQTLHVHSP